MLDMSIYCRHILYSIKSNQIKSHYWRPSSVAQGRQVQLPNMEQYNAYEQQV